MTPHSPKKQRKARAKDLKLLEGNWGQARTQWELTYVYAKPARPGLDSGAATVSTFSTNATMDSNPGAGRMLDRLYQYLGRKIEQGILNLRMRVDLVPPSRILDRLFDKARCEMAHRIINMSMDFTLKRLRENKGGVAVSGVLSLVHQTRSKSIHRSAAAIMALIQLSTSDVYYGDVYFNSAKDEQISNLETLVQSLNHSHPQKALFFSLNVLARAHIVFLHSVVMIDLPDSLDVLQEEMIEIEELMQANEQNALLIFSKAYYLLVKLDRIITLNRNQRNADWISETAYFLFFILIRCYGRVRCTGGDRQFSASILSICTSHIDILFGNIWQMLLRPAASYFPWHDATPSAYYGIDNPICCDTEIKEIFPKTIVTVKKEHYIQHNFTVPRRLEIKKEQILLQFPFATLPRTYRLFQHREELEREAREQVARDIYEAPMSKSRSYRLCHDLNHSLRCARSIHIQDKSYVLAAEFLRARSYELTCGCIHSYSPRSHICEDCFDLWQAYKQKCHFRKVWGEYLCNDLDWDWDLSSCLQRLFKIESTMDGTSPIETRSSEVQGDTLNICVNAVHSDSLKKVRMAYRTTSGETKYRIFIAYPSTEDLPSRPEHNAFGSQTRTYNSLTQVGEVEHLAGREDVDKGRYSEAGSLSGKEFGCTDGSSKGKMKARASEDSGAIVLAETRVVPCTTVDTIHAHMDSPEQSVTGFKSETKNGSEEELDDVDSIYWSAIDVPVVTN